MSEDSFPRMPRRNRPVDDPKMIGLWKIGRTIGTGSSGRTGQHAAIKIVSKASFSSQMSSLKDLADEADHNQLALEREIVVMKLIDHPNIMRLYDVWETSTELYLILEYVQGGELFEYLCEKGRLSTLEALGYFQQIIAGTNYCHQFNIAHRDLKPENILLDKDSNIKIVDFGMAAWQAVNEDGMLRTSCGSPHYAAPEIISGNPYNGSAADIWSCGVILYALLCGRLPFDDEDCPTLLEKVLLGEFTMPDDIDPLAQDLISRMLTKDTDARITMPDILRHPFFMLETPKPAGEIPPRLSDISQPIGDIDSDIFDNLRTLWHGTPDSDIIENLQDGKQNWHKRIYYLLIEYRRKHLEDSLEEHKLVQSRRTRRRKNSGNKSTPKEVGFPSPPSWIPPRDDPPTPRRASLGCNIFPLNSGDAPGHLPISDPAAELRPASPSSEEILSPLSSVLATLQSPQLTTKDLQDEKIQAFLNQIIDQLHVLQAKTNPSEMPEPMAPLSTLIKADDLVHLGLSENVTKPLTVRRKTHPKGRKSIQTVIPDKENVPYTQLIPSSPTVKDRSSLRDGARRLGLVNKKVHIVEPASRERVKLKKKRATFRSSGTESSTSVKPPNYSLLSVHGVDMTRSECQRLLVEMNAQISTLEESPGLSVLKCRLDEVKDQSGVMGILKPVKFRVELQHTLDGQRHLEKGSGDTFEEICKRFRRDWTLDATA
ncbi:kinase-like domain-containing protein [Infundibulicybe gibba]|nr:kinase-like domain-containing protein [Infundibulicybe gibba]